MQEIRKYSINWQSPTDELINQEMHELLNNCEFFFFEENFDKVFSKIPSFYFYVVKKYLKKDTVHKEEIKKLVVGKNPESIGMGPAWSWWEKFNLNPPQEIKKEIFNLIKSGKLVDWNKVEETGNMGDFTQVFGHKSWKGGIKYCASFEPGDEGIEDLRARLDKDLSKLTVDLERYFITYDELVKEKLITKPAPFIINLKNDGKPYHLIGGHKRSTIALQLGIPVKAWFIEF
jgi:hypothetical protein